MKKLVTILAPESRDIKRHIDDDDELSFNKNKSDNDNLEPKRDSQLNFKSFHILKQNRLLMAVAHVIYNFEILISIILLLSTKHNSTFRLIFCARTISLGLKRQL